mgnify:FL=1
MSIGKKLYFGVVAVFLLFAASFIVFQHEREKTYKIDVLDTKLQDYNERMAEVLELNRNMSESSIDRYVRTHYEPDLRVTLIDMKGKVFYDNKFKNYAAFENHLGRDEIREALKNGSGYDIDRKSSTLGQSFFYSATSFPSQHFIIRSALPYNTSLARMLQTDQHYVWFSLVAMLLLTLLLYRFTHRLGMNIQKLRTFANRADHNESLETEDLVAFPNDELGEIAEKIIKIYKRLQHTKQEQNILKRQLTQNIAHELKTPVASIMGYMETILDNPKIDEKMKEQFLQRCYAQAQRLTSLLRDISTLNRLDDASEMLTDFDDIDIVQLIDNIQRETALQMEENRMNFVCSLPESVKIRGNQSLIYSVFRNLTDNAIAYAGQGTTIALNAEDEGDKWHFTFSDNGVGVPHEHLARLFERFYRVDKGRSRKMGGTGLGLAIVKNAVLLHGGTISVRNGDNGGLVFDFTLKK